MKHNESASDWVNGIPTRESLGEITSIPELLEIWKQTHKTEMDTDYISGTVPKTAFLPDGIINEELYAERKEKVLFVGKEAYWFAPDGSAEENNKYAENVMFWHREVAMGTGNASETMFSKRLSLLANAIFSDDYTTINKSHVALRSTAVINLNKRGGFSYCVWDTLEGYVSRYRDFISKEIELIAPTMIICCGNGVRWLLDKYITVPKKAKLVTVSHPSYFALSDSAYLHQLECAAKGTEWVAKHEVKTEAKAQTRNKGIIFDTNKSYSEGATFDMLTSGKISAYGKASRFIDSFSLGDYAFYYVKGKGVVAAGKVISDLAESAETDGWKESYKMVQMIVPKMVPAEENQLQAISPGELKLLLDQGFFFASTVKKPYLSMDESEKLIAELRMRYCE